MDMTVDNSHRAQRTAGGAAAARQGGGGSVVSPPRCHLHVMGMNGHE
jgi:hypothetical protein